MRAVTQRCLRIVVALITSRRWLRFSLRTLFLVLTSGCFWLAWQVQVVQERKSLWKAVIENDGEIQTYDPCFAFLQDGAEVRTCEAIRAMANQLLAPPDYDEQIPWIRKMIGDVAIKEIVLPDDFPRSRRMKQLHDQLAMAFPEASIDFENYALSGGI